MHCSAQAWMMGPPDEMQCSAQQGGARHGRAQLTQAPLEEDGKAVSMKLHTALLNGSTATDEVLELEDEVVVSNGTGGTLVRRAVLKTIAGIELDLLHGNELPKGQL